MKAGYPNFNVLTDTISNINGLPINSSTVYAITLSTALPKTFFVEQDSNGRDCLCCDKLDGGSFTITDSNLVEHVAVPFEPIYNENNELVGTRPPVKR